jgi:choline-sulfatase
MYDPADSVLPSDGYDVNEELPLVFQLATSASATRPEADDATGVRAFLASVRGLVRQVDDALGRLVDQMDLDDTVLFFTSDHGDFSGHRGLMRKNPKIPFDDLARVPFFVTGRGIEGGRRVTDLVQSFDIALTCLDFAGVDPPADVDFDSRTLRPILDGTQSGEDRERVVMTATSLSWPMVRQGRYKYIANTAQDDPVLFDLEADPHERTNLVDDSAYRSVARRLAGRLAVVMERPALDVPAPTGGR